MLATAGNAVLSERLPASWKMEQPDKGMLPVSNLLEYLKEMQGKWHIIERSIEVDGEYLRFTQDRDTMVVTTPHGEGYARLSCRIEDRPAPDGWFWLRNWSENAEFWEKVKHHFEVGTEVVQVSPFVDTVAARFLYSPAKEEKHDQQEA